MFVFTDRNIGHKNAQNAQGKKELDRGRSSFWIELVHFVLLTYRDVGNGGRVRNIGHPFVAILMLGGTLLCAGPRLCGNDEEKVTD